MNKDKYSESVSMAVNKLNEQLRQQRMKEQAIRAFPEELEDKDCHNYVGGQIIDGVHGIIIEIDELNTQEAETEGYEVGEAPDQSKEIKSRYGVFDYEKLREFGKKLSPEGWDKEEAATTILSSAIEQVEQMGDYKVMMALVDLEDTKPKEERLYTFCDIESKKLRGVIYNEMEKEFE